MESNEIKQEIKKAIDKAEYSYDYCKAADSIIKNLGDEYWAKEVYNKAIDKAEDTHDYSHIAESIIENLGDKVWGKELYIKGLDKAETVNHYRNIAGSIIENLGDKDWGKELYSKALDKAETSNDYSLVGADIIYLLKDKQLGKKIYLKALDQAENAKDYRKIAADVTYHLEDEDWAAEILKEGDDPYEIAPLSGPFGYMREGDGTVVYLSNSETDISVRIKQVTDLVYDKTVEYDGEKVVDFSEYDVDNFDSELFDDCSIFDVAEMVKGSLSYEDKFELLVNKDILSKGIALIFIDSENKTISQIENIDELHKIILRDKDDLRLYIREYDHVYDY